MSPTVNASKNAKEVVKPSKLNNVRDVLDEQVGMLSRQPLQRDAREVTLTLTTTNVADVEESLESQEWIFIERFDE